MSQAITFTRKLLTFVFFFVLIFFSSVIIFFFILENEYSKALYYTVQNWDNNKSDNEASFLLPASSPYLYGLKEYYETETINQDTFFWINFQNSKNNFLTLDSLLTDKLKSSLYLDNYVFDPVDSSKAINFCWNTSDLVYKLNSINDLEYQLYLRLFSFKYTKKGNEYFINKINSRQLEGTDSSPFFKSQSNLNVDNIKYQFHISNDSISLKDGMSFNFIFLEQAQNFIDSNYGEKKYGKAYKFYSKNELLAILDYSNPYKLGYQVKFES